MPLFIKSKLRDLFKFHRGLTVDSGAADSVFPTGWIKKSWIRASMGSLRGLFYIAASGTRIANDGEFTFGFFSKEGHKGSLISQCAKVNKPLCSVSHLPDNGFCVVLNRHDGKDVSYIFHKPTKIIMKLRRERGVFVLDTWTELEVKSAEPGFIRPS